MCGIAGLAGFQDNELLREMTSRLCHRGPDEEGFHCETEASLGNRRLAIIDLEGGKQPMSTRDGKVWVTFNGQIYNHLDLRRQLASSPPSPQWREGQGGEVGNLDLFQTRCDTEILPVLYQMEGEAFVNRLRGMFAFALWDQTRKRLLLVRDRVGVKPLYYAQLGSRLLFASEPKALLACPEIDRTIDPVALDAYLSLLYVPPPLSIYQGIRQLPPGHILTWQEGEITIIPYWDAEPALIKNRSFEEWGEEISPILFESIRMRLMSDVPLGVFLSGGIDSSTILSVLAEHSSKPVETFCVGFGPEGSAYEERPYARKVAEYFGANHHEMEVSINITQGLEEIARSFDEPFGNPTALLTSRLSQYTRQFVTVALTGDGGDEMFGGYPRYQGMLWSEHLKHLPLRMREAALKFLSGKEFSTARNYRRWLRELIADCDLPPALRYHRWNTYCSQVERDALLAPAIKDQLQQQRMETVAKWYAQPHQGGVMDRARYADLHGFLPENVLRNSDRMSMVHSLEVRVPYTDHLLVEALAQVPARHHISHFATKRLLRHIAKDRLPAEPLRRKKLGFNPPLGIWLQKDSLGLFQEYLHPDLVKKRGHLNPERVRQLIQEHQSHFRDHSLRLWSLIVIEAWERL
jgi:asparagine synthase (glutamine-hydrolysing)